jgi:hypothetical protein
MTGPLTTMRSSRYIGRAERGLAHQLRMPVELPLAIEVGVGRGRWCIITLL